jgi:tRNA dimethylallyltransferase
MKPKIVILTGPTGAGKTALSLNLAQVFNAEIVNADSMQIYRYMDIGTAKPTLEERTLVPHHLIDIRNPEEDYDASQFKTDANEVIKDILSRKKQVLVVGGTMLYLKVLIHGIFPAPPIDVALRQRLQQLVKEQGREYLYQWVNKIDPKAAKKIKPRDIIRLIRAIEVYELTGKPISWHQKHHHFAEQEYCYLKVCLYRPRDVLYHRIEERVEEMFAQGLVKEVENLLKMEYTPYLKPMQAIGYRHVIACLEGKHGLEEAKALIKRDTRRYAKRQLSWFRQETDMLWYLPEEKESIKGAISQFLEN